MKEDRREALRRYLNRPGTERVEVSLSPEAAQALRLVAGFGVSGDFPEVTQMYASRLLEQALEDLGPDPVEGLTSMSPREPSPLQVGSDAPDAVLVGPDGEPVALKDQWGEQTALLVFLRHYG